MRRVCQPVGAVGDIGPAARRRDPPGERLDIALHVVEPRDLVGEPWVRDMAAALAQMAEQPADEARVRIGAELAEIGQPARRPQPRDHCRRADAVAHPGLVGEPLEHREIDRLGGRRAALAPSGRASRLAISVVDARRVRLALAPVEVLEPRQAVLLDREHFLGREGVRAFLVSARRRCHRADGARRARRSAPSRRASAAAGDARRTCGARRRRRG